MIAIFLILILISGCDIEQISIGEESGEVEIDDSSSYVYKLHDNAKWTTPEEHGLYVISNSRVTCATSMCHGEDYLGGRLAGGCSDCHSAPYPHDDTWSVKDDHGIYVLNNGKGSCANSCHGADLKGGDSAVSCQECHLSYPHEDSWVLSAKHGDYVEKNGKETCATACHGSDLTGGDSKISCNLCHENYPHKDNWVEKTSHGKYAIENGKDLCATCHGDDFTGGTSGASCYQCHETYPHSQEWNIGSSNNHGIYVVTNSTESCTTCHGEDLSGGDSNMSCNACHESYPHETNWSGQDYHGDYALNNGVSDCGTCHGPDYTGGNSLVSCYSCHETYPHENLWSQSSNHGLYVVSNGRTDCVKCHGSDLSGGKSNTSCFMCHETYPHETNWALKENHGMAALENNVETCASNCHGNDYKGGESGISCYLCHDIYPHESSWVNPKEHGYKMIGGDPANVKLTCGTSCHGEDFKGGDSEISCETCHELYPHEMIWSDKTLNHGDYVVSLNSGESCATLCHGEEYEGGDSEKSCTETCHTFNAKDQDAPHNAEKQIYCKTCHSTPDIPTSNSCLACHYKSYKMDKLDHHGYVCIDCHEPHTHQVALEDKKNIKYIRNKIIDPHGVERPVIFTSQTCDYSFADGKAENGVNGICEVCHYLNEHDHKDNKHEYFRNDGTGETHTNRDCSGTKPKMAGKKCSQDCHVHTPDTTMAYKPFSACDLCHEGTLCKEESCTKSLLSGILYW
jgi:hypothetical protein